MCIFSRLRGYQKFTKQVLSCKFFRVSFLTNFTSWMQRHMPSQNLISGKVVISRMEVSFIFGFQIREKSTEKVAVKFPLYRDLSSVWDKKLGDHYLRKMSDFPVWTFLRGLRDVPSEIVKRQLIFSSGRLWDQSPVCLYCFLGKPPSERPSAQASSVGKLSNARSPCLVLQERGELLIWTTTGTTPDCPSFIFFLLSI